jgi:PAS domain S-box-containing protein
VSLGTGRGADRGPTRPSHTFDNLSTFADPETAKADRPLSTASLAGAGPCAARDFALEDLLSLVGAGADWIWETDGELRFSWFSDNFEEVTGLAPEAILGRRRFDFLKQAQAGSVSVAAHLADLDARRPFRNFVYELNGTRPDCRWISITGYPRFDVDGSFAGYRGIAHNVTSVVTSVDEIGTLQRKLAAGDEQGTADTPAGEQHAERLMAALDVMKDAFCYHDGDDRLVVYNKAFARLFSSLADVIRPGLKYEELLDTGLDRGLWDLEGLDRTAWRQSALRRRREPRWQTTVRTADGRLIVYREMRTADGGVMGISTDVRELVVQQEKAHHVGDRTTELLADLRSIVDSMSIGILVLDADLRAEIINKAFYDFWHIDRGRIGEGAAFRDLMEISRHVDARGGDEADWQAHVARREAELRSGATASRELERSDGRFMICTQAPLSGGKVLVSYVDVTELKERETELAEARDGAADLFANLRGIVDTMSVGILVLDRNLKAEVINRAFYRLWDMTPENTPEGSTLRQIMEASRDVDTHGVGGEAAWQAQIARREEELRNSRGGSQELRLADGRTLICTMVRLAGGRLLTSYVDVTEMKTREVELAEALEKARLAEAVVDAVDYPIFVKDNDLRFVLVNSSFAKAYGLTPAEMIGKKAADLVKPDEAAEFEASSRGVLETGTVYEAAEDFEFHGIGKSRIIRKNRVTTQGNRNYVAGFVFDVTELKRRETEAEEARKHLADVLESLPASVLIYDRDDGYVFANQKVKEAMPALNPIWRPGATFREAFELGHSVGYFRTSGNPGVDALYDTDKERWLDGIIGEYRVRRAEFERRNPDGTWQKVYNMRADDGTFIGVRVDITELKQREEALRDSMGQVDLLRQTLDELPVAVNIKSPDLRLEYVNKAWTEITGLAREAAVGHTDLELFELAEADGYTHCDEQVSRTGIPVETEEPVVHRDGTLRQLMTRKTRLIASDGSVHLVGSSTDITDVKARESQLNESLRENEVFRNLIDNVPVAIYAKRDLRIFYVNQGWCDLTGVSREFATGKTDVEIFGSDGEAYMEGDRAVLRLMRPQEIAETMTALDGTLRHRIARKSVMTATDGSLYVIGSTTDVTELKHRERELDEARHKAVLADRAKSEFLANMSHEIRTPMNGVLGMAELLAKSELTPKQKMFTDIIVKSGTALLTIINDILDFSKIDAGQLVLDPQPFNLAEAIEDVATLVSARAKEKDIEMIVRVEPSCQHMFVGDVGRIRQIITNLLGNAVKFTDTGHVLVDVSGEKLDGRTRLRVGVTDTGIGIPADKLKTVFEKFSQVDSSSTRRHEGTGLGLAITSRLVELMGGEIGVESVEGKGSTFWFAVTLPDAGRPEGRRPPPLDVTGARILVIDDNAINRAILSEQMQSWTFDSCAVESGSEGIRVLEAAAAYGVAVDCVVLDYQMPEMTGAEVARVIRSTPGIAGTPIIMLTSVDQTLAGPAYRDLGIEAQLIKPARSSALLETLVGTIQRHRSVAGASTIAEWRAETNASVRRADMPEADVPAAAAAASDVPAPYEAPAVEHRVDILVAEDNEVNQLVFTQILSDSPYTFAIVANGRLAVEAHAEMKPRMVLMDVSMPEMNGIEATAAIRRAEAGGTSHLPIVGVTAHALKGDRERCLEAGMDDYLPKPISPKALLDKIEKWIQPDGARQRSAG